MFAFLNLTHAAPETDDRDKAKQRSQVFAWQECIL